MLTAKELIEVLNKLPPNQKIDISIDTSINDENSEHRVFSDEYLGTVTQRDETTLLFTGQLND